LFVAAAVDAAAAADARCCRHRLVAESGVLIVNKHRDIV
jgi:hypothetical protein